jgi:hypothetical protein
MKRLLLALAVASLLALFSYDALASQSKPIEPLPGALHIERVYRRN